ncbi:transporter [Cohaesibacter celericrescens]|uniref:Transporter n=1 Tax=Cohaesibacter celericrescens TaxID=2067669 RepID=A0A2N5XV45_9HYPH|nr:transporter [Cohaesibacter celericrescens]PLW78359.1 transporter [Cohaesibacter celericrescens]
MTYLPFILFTVFTNASAQIMMKQGMMTLGDVAPVGGMTAFGLITMVFKIIFHPWIFAGLCTFVISMASHLYVLGKVELSFAYPFLSLAYVGVVIAAWWWFAEDLNVWRIAGIGFICIGTALIAQGGSDDRGQSKSTENQIGLNENVVGQLSHSHRREELA